MRTPHGTTRTGFSLVETLVASMILSGSVVALGAISTNALRGVRLNRHYETAASLIERQLTMIDHIGISEFVEQGQTSGVFEQYDPPYGWDVSTQYQETDSLYLVTITITWMEGKRPRKVTAQTMLNGQGLTLTVPTGES